MSKIRSSFLGLLQLAQILDASPSPGTKKRKIAFRDNAFYKGLSLKRVKGKWRVKQ